MHNFFQGHGHLLPIEEIKKRKMQLLVTIVNRGQGQEITELFHERHFHFNYVMMAEGTASSEILDLLGLGGVDKVMILTLAPAFVMPKLIKSLSKKLELSKAGRGIAFTIPLSGVSSPVLQIIDKEVRDNLEEELEKEVENVHTNATHDLIVAVVNQGCTEELMTVAKAAGATGGTIVHARRIGAEEAVKFFGISIQMEKEVVAILTSREKKQEIMKAIGKDFGLKTDAKGIIFSLPVDSTVGLEG